MARSLTQAGPWRPPAPAPGACAQLITPPLRITPSWPSEESACSALRVARVQRECYRERHQPNTSVTGSERAWWGWREAERKGGRRMGGRQVHVRIIDWLLGGVSTGGAGVIGARRGEHEPDSA
eukprot:105889-Rhodomonas_salina.1